MQGKHILHLYQGAFITKMCRAASNPLKSHICINEGKLYLTGSVMRPLLILEVFREEVRLCIGKIGHAEEKKLRAFCGVLRDVALQRDFINL